LTAEWELRGEERAARVKLALAASAGGEYALGYHAAARRPLGEVEELLLPLMWQRKRFPNRAQTLLDPVTPSPLSLVQVKGPMTWGVIGEAEKLPFAWPNPDWPHFGLNIRDDVGRVQPSIYGPVPGTAAAKVEAGGRVELSLRVLAMAGDWYGGYRVAADEVCGWRDYRSNVGTSLTDAALNMIDLMKDDEAGGWWERAKGFIQIETKNGVTHAAPLLPMSVFRLTGDEEIYRRRALPTVEFMLSRSLPHFSPTPEDTGPYAAGGMEGPIRAYGSAGFGGMWELLGRRTEAAREIAFSAAGVSPKGAGHHSAFDEWMARYAMTGDAAALAKAREVADRYVVEHVNKAPAQDFGVMPFFFISFVPNWEGLLQLYEVTGERRYLDAAAFGARQLMTGVWTQPAPPAGEVEVHPTGSFAGDTLASWRKDRHYRLGAPREAGDTPAHRVPAWVVSNVGLSFEQPSTIRGRGQDRLIYQMGWAPGFLRLARHTGDRIFETYARNATLGRFANYPGYYATGFTDLPLNPRYPYEGPDVTDFYYHHIAPHLMWTIDYLVADAELRSGGRIAFPYQRQIGYAYFDNRVFGHAAGTVYGEKGVWLWLRRGLVEVDNPQVNYLTARAGGKILVVLTNQANRAEEVGVKFLPEVLKFDHAVVRAVSMIGADGGRSPATLEGGRARVNVPPRGLVVLELEGIRAEVPVHAVSEEVRGRGMVVMKTELGVEVKGAAIAPPVARMGWDAYVWCTATPKQVAKATLHYRAGGDWQTMTCAAYPFEFSVHVPEGQGAVEFNVELQTVEGQMVTTAGATIRK
jgi:hypothetical protein